MHNLSSHKTQQVTVPNIAKPRPNEVVISLFPGTIASYVPEGSKEVPISVWYWIFVAALFLALGWIAWTQEQEEWCLQAQPIKLADPDKVIRDVAADRKLASSSAVLLMNFACTKR